jgi:hypothetical protein
MAFYPNSATPLIIVGRQRAGTRFLTDALNSFDHVTIQSEVPSQVMRSAERMMRETENYYQTVSESGGARRKAEYERWRTKRVDLLFAIWADASQGGRIKAHKNCRYFGYKRPGHEFLFSFYESMLENKKPYYIYCTRNFIDNYLSVISRWPDRSIEKVADDYRESIKQFNKMKCMARDRVLVFNLDQHKRGGIAYLEEHIIRPLGLSLSETQRKFLTEMGPVNQTESLEGVKRRHELTAEEASFIRSRRDLTRDFRRLTSLQPIQPAA